MKEVPHKTLNLTEQFQATGTDMLTKLGVQYHQIHKGGCQRQPPGLFGLWCTYWEKQKHSQWVVQKTHTYRSMPTLWLIPYIGI